MLEPVREPLRCVGADGAVDVVVERAIAAITQNLGNGVPVCARNGLPHDLHRPIARVRGADGGGGRRVGRRGGDEVGIREGGPSPTRERLDEEVVFRPVHQARHRSRRSAHVVVVRAVGPIAIPAGDRVALGAGDRRPGQADPAVGDGAHHGLGLDGPGGGRGGGRGGVFGKHGSLSVYVRREMILGICLPR